MSGTCRPQSRAEREEAQARPGLDAWAGFPADRRPRPLVLLSETARPGGFPTGQAKQAFYDGLVTAGPDFPAPVLRALRRSPRGGREVPPLFLTRATFGETWFDTDRGRQTLPAWCFWAQDVTAPVWVLDPATAREAWQPPGWVPGAWHHEEAGIPLNLPRALRPGRSRQRAQRGLQAAVIGFAELDGQLVEAAGPGITIPQHGQFRLISHCCSPGSMATATRPCS